MKIKGQFVVALSRICCDAKLHAGIKLVDGLRLIDDANRIDCLKHARFQKAVGELEMNYLATSKLLVMSEIRDFEVEIVSQGAEVAGYLLNVVRLYLFHLWMIRDCCAYFEQGFLFSHSDSSTHSNLLVTSLSKADGSRVDTSFSRRELESVRLIQRNVSEIVPNAAEISIQSNARLTLVSDKDVDVFDRFRRFVFLSRETRDLGLKIAMCCSGLEAMLSSGSNAELTHRIAERVAVLIGENATQKVAIFETMKKLYAIRSSVLHGDDVSKKHLGNMATFSKTSDTYVRRISHLYYNDEAFKKAVLSGGEDLEVFFIRKLFGIS